MTFTSAGGYDDEIPNDLDVEMGEKNESSIKLNSLQI